MELLPVETLADQIKRGAIPIEEALPVANQIAEALEEAHEKAVIHRDLTRQYQSDPGRQSEGAGLRTGEGR